MYGEGYSWTAALQAKDTGGTEVITTVSNMQSGGICIYLLRVNESLVKMENLSDGVCDGCWLCTVLREGTVSYTHLDVYKRQIYCDGH